MNRDNMLNALVSDIVSKQIERPMLIAVTGITASGKTNLANEINLLLLKSGFKAFRASIDDFHNPSSVRNLPEKESWLSYYEAAHDYNAIKEKLLVPLSNNENLKYQLASFDLVEDKYINCEPKQAEKESICIVDGTFLLRHELNAYWTYRIFVQTDFKIALQRGVERDCENLDGRVETEQRYLNRYHKASRHYLDNVKPDEKADVIVVNNKLDSPRLIFRD